MSREKLVNDDLEETPNTEAILGFITRPQFTATKQHFEGVLESMKHDKSLQRFRMEFSKLLQAFQSCYAENERKTRKIFELKALSTVQVPKVKGVDPVQQVTIKNLKEAIRHLQQNLDDSNEERRQLVEEIQVLKATMDTKNKLIQVHADSLENLKEGDSSLRLTSGLKDRKDNIVVKHESTKRGDTKGELLLETSLEEEKGVTDITVLKNNLEISLAGLKMARKKIQEMKKQIYAKDILVKNVSKDLYDTEGKLVQAQTKILEITKPMEAELANVKTELEGKRQELKDTTKQLEKALALNEKLTKDISSKDSIIEDLKTDVKELESAKESAHRRTNVFENHLASSQRHVEKLKGEIENLKDEVTALNKQIPTEIHQKASQPDRETLNHNALERTIETMKGLIASRDNKVQEMDEELKNTVEILVSHRKDLILLIKEKAVLENDRQITKKRLNERNDEVRRLRELLKAAKREIAELERELQVETKKRQQALDKKNKFHSMYNHLKMMNSQQKDENLLLGKRQQYLVKILKEKDMEIERIVTWKRYVY